jgi:predicted GIY-YIG superfamily endonuclease
MENKTDNIYIYLWEEFNTIYVGRTKNPKSRHYQHRHLESESTYQFSSEHHVEHPKMIIIENNLTLEEGTEREIYWINYYVNNSSYNVLNKSRGGQTGRVKVYTDVELKKRRREQVKTVWL